MNSTIFIPKKIKVGFQNRSDTYTKKLAYVIYYDQHNKLRKEKSWKGWKDDKIPDLDFSNEPTSGFVLNKKVGGYDTGWNHRQTYCRIYDPRDFEFEITIENLLYILENTSSIKGKGLEGQFVYGWDKDKLILIPVDSPDYKELTQYNEIIHSKNYIKSKDLIIGATYKTKDNEEWIYMGRFDKWDIEYELEQDRNGYKRKNYNKPIDINKGKHYWFAIKNEKYTNIYFKQLKSLGDKFISTISSDCIDDYSNLFDKLEIDPDYSPIDKTKSEFIPYTLEEFCKQIEDAGWGKYFHDANDNLYEVNKIWDSSSRTYKLNKCYYDERKNDFWNRYNRIELTYEEIFNEIKPVHKKLYLQNGKFYREEY